MKNKLMTILPAALMGVMLAAAPLLAEQYESSDTLVFDVGTSPSLILKNISGDYRISGWDRPVIEVSYKKKAKGSSAKIKAELVTVRAEQTDNRVFVEVKYPDARERRARGLDYSFNVSVDFEINVPQDCRIETSNVSGDGILLNINGDVDAGTTSGDITATALAGNVKLYTTSGDIELSGGNGVIELYTTSGDIEARGVRGRVKAIVTSGNVTLAANALQEGVFKSVSGDVEVSVEEPITSGTFSLSSYSGDVELTLPAESAFEIRAKTMTGDIDTDFDLPRPSGKFKRELSGKVNGGGAIINASASVGDVDINKK
jgi:DUF4097 and DUF4098 domain-containing protein YvlB